MRKVDPDFWYVVRFPVPWIGLSLRAWDDRNSERLSVDPTSGKVSMIALWEQVQGQVDHGFVHTERQVGIWWRS